MEFKLEITDQEMYEYGHSEAKEVASHYACARNIQASKCMDAVHAKLSEVQQVDYQVGFLTQMIGHVNQSYTNHLKVCEHKEKPRQCSTNSEYLKLKPRLASLFISMEHDLTTAPKHEDYLKFHEKIDEVITRVNELQLGQKILFDQAVEELEDLKTQTFNRVKDMRQTTLGKITDMVLAGMISTEVANMFSTSLIGEIAQRLSIDKIQ